MRTLGPGNPRHVSRLLEHCPHHRLPLRELNDQTRVRHWTHRYRCRPRSRNSRPGRRRDSWNNRPSHRWHTLGGPNMRVPLSLRVRDPLTVIHFRDELHGRPQSKSSLPCNPRAGRRFHPTLEVERMAPAYSPGPVGTPPIQGCGGRSDPTTTRRSHGRTRPNRPQMGNRSALLGPSG
jgi:hypothetical protein